MTISFHVRHYALYGNFCQVNNHALSQLCVFCSPDRRKESANLCYGDVSPTTVKPCPFIATVTPETPGTFTMATCDPRRELFETRLDRVSGILDVRGDGICPEFHVRNSGQNSRNRHSRCQ